MDDRAVYSALFELTSQNMENAGKEFRLSEKAFLFMTENPPQKADIFQISKEKENDIFLEECYLALLKRICDEGAYFSWKERFSLPWYEFQRRLTIALISSDEYSRNQVRAFNHIYSQRNIYGGNLSRIPTPAKLNIPEKLLRFYRKQPKFLRKMERKILGMN